MSTHNQPSTPLTEPTMAPPFHVAADIICLPSWLPVPGAGMLPVNSFLLLGKEPILVDTGLSALKDQFLKVLDSILPPEQLRWIWISHTDADHIGNLTSVLARAPKAEVVTNFLGMGKMNMLGCAPEHFHMLEIGQSLETQDRALTAVRPLYYDAPETMGFSDAKNKTLFAADAFGALLSQQYMQAEDIPAVDLRTGLMQWAQIDAPWLSMLDDDKFSRAVENVKSEAHQIVLSGHLPPQQSGLGDLPALVMEAQEHPHN
ncbi:MBL fold metallo-hydrolase [Kordiimonas lacus]|uniref:Metallo-beta-lactamase superfamily protein n=1 Tax=Kordiimonas lacus TaxID=637679 RepID=A0A1G7D7D6_9PROT|nr:MBL fold metallo-hydrolase [Kordiimonas lacus]SDE46836.1 Metallo-beta-lactamase superfamily protein [Kordiimonas lacus]